MSFTLMPQEYTKQEGSQVYKLTRVRPYIRVGSEGESLFLQEGKVYTLGGEVVKTVPAWCQAEIAKLTPAARAEVGFPELPKVN